MSESKEYMTQAQEFGALHISEDVVATIAALAIADVEGVHSLSTSVGSDIAELLGKKNLSKGIKLVLEENTVQLECFVVIQYGYAIPEVAGNIQQSIANAVESMTGLQVVQVNVNVTGISMDKK